MGANHLVVLLLATVTQSPTPDYLPSLQHPGRSAPRGTRHVAAARGRFRRVRLSGTDPLRLTVGVGRRRWAQVPASAVEEQVADVQWQRPNDLRVDVVGRRSRSRSEALELSSVWDRPWFVPRAVDDSVRIFSDEFPATGALHPLARSWPRVVPLRPDQRALGHPGEGEHAAAPPGGRHPQADGASAHRRADVDRLCDRGSRSSHLPVRGDRALGEAGRHHAVGFVLARRMNSFANQIVSVDADLEYGSRTPATGCRTAR